MFSFLGAVFSSVFPIGHCLLFFFGGHFDAEIPFFVLFVILGGLLTNVFSWFFFDFRLIDSHVETIYQQTKCRHKADNSRNVFFSSYIFSAILY